jgi:hypothetical protein
MASPRPLPDPYGCRDCGVPVSEHGRRYHSAVGVHQWQGPRQDQILSRMQARRAAHLAQVTAREEA